MHAFAFLLRHWLAAALLVLLAGWQPPAQAQAPRDSAVKAAFLYKFGSFVEWPAGSFRTPQDPLVIGVLADPPVAADLEQLVVGRTVEGRPVAVKVLKEGEPAAGVHVLFVGTLRPSKLRELLAGLSGPVLVVTEQDGALQSGSVINFVADGARVRFNASLASAEARGLRLSARLLAVASSVEGLQR
ncbi:MAG: hypothetical protein JWQ13_424 [Ramlibacter sp.]|jgi:hypothetical protein|nr:hypothetical protein [Ramlibacter sp.]